VNKPLAALTKTLFLLLCFALNGCSGEFSAVVSNNFRAMYLCQDHGGFKEILENKSSAFTVKCKDGLIVHGTND
jgi:hypothetical protein